MVVNSIRDGLLAGFQGMLLPYALRLYSYMNIFHLAQKLFMNFNEEIPENLGGLGDMLPADVLKMVNELLEQLHRKDKDHQGSIVLNIYEKGSLHVDHVDNQNFYGDKWVKALQNKVVADDQPSAEPVFDKDTPLSVLFRDNFHSELRKVIESWRPYLIGDASSIDALAMTLFEFDRKRIYSNRVYYDLLDLDDLGALQVPLSQLANYLADHSNLSQSYDTLYRQLKKYRQERQ
jgi:hypothetical protein